MPNSSDRYTDVYGHFPEWLRIQMLKETREMFAFGYDSYMKYAFPLDELDPIHCTGEMRTWKLNGGFLIIFLAKFSSGRRTTAVWPDWATFESPGDWFSYKTSPNIGQLFELFLKPLSLHKHCFGYFLGNFGEDWANINSCVWSHWTIVQFRA